MHSSNFSFVSYSFTLHIDFLILFVFASSVRYAFARIICCIIVVFSNGSDELNRPVVTLWCDRNVHTIIIG